MKFLRHLASVALLVVLVVVGGLAWGHADPGPLPGRGPGGAGPVFVQGHPVAVLPSGGKIPPRGLRLINTGPMNLGLNSMFQAVNLPVLRGTVAIEAGVVAAVVLLEIGHWRWRRARRLGRLPGPGQPVLDAFQDEVHAQPARGARPVEYPVRRQAELTCSD